MNLIEKLEYVIGLVGKSKDAEIKSILTGMYEEVSGKSRTIEDLEALQSEKAKVDSKLLSVQGELEQFKSPPRTPSGKIRTTGGGSY
jgi:hypothetical protein